ncbi:putative toxin-antitoxin system toxin component, PIN family [Ideonella sp.]|uniref:PIN domain-containing protein n=1 Tax=Ideonella sp. TaxID=1929293 RepID=UPI0035B3DAFC
MPPRVVLDTQVVLDWRYFGDRALADWSLPGASWHWVATAAMREELAHVLRRGFDARWTTPADDVLHFFDAHSSPCATAALAPDMARRLACRDPDDQKFIDLAVALAPSCLVSRDRAVLALSRRAAALDVRILPPSRWAPPA